MKPGRELDALVAEKVFGYRLTEDGTTWYLEHDIRGPKFYDTDLPRYSEDIAAAWEVWLTLFAKGWEPHLIQFRHTIAVSLHQQDTVCDAINIDAPTAPHAICLAALKAVSSRSSD